MNIIVVRPDGTFYTRPDTTLSRFPRDFYMPESLSEVTAVTCSYIRITKAGKAVPQRFAYRYFDALGRGVMLYCDNLPYVDASSYFFQEMTPSSNLTPEHIGAICSKIAEITLRMSVRFADLVAFEDSGGIKYHRGDTVDPYPSAEPSLSFRIF